MLKNYFKSALRFFRHNKVFVAINLFCLSIAAALILIPMTLYFVIKWLYDFAFRTNINPLTFVASFTISAIIVLLTVYINAYKASRINPVEVLRYE